MGDARLWVGEIGNNSRVCSQRPSTSHDGSTGPRRLDLLLLPPSLPISMHEPHSLSRLSIHVKIFFFPHTIITVDRSYVGLLVSLYDERHTIFHLLDIKHTDLTKKFFTNSDYVQNKEIRPNYNIINYAQNTETRPIYYVVKET